MERKYLLSALKDTIEVNEKECWELIDNVYDFLINNLSLNYEPNSSVFEGGSNAVPHMFEQMLLFHKAFLNNKNPEHDRAVAEWQAVLAIMALQKVCNVQLDVCRVDLSGENNIPFLKAAFNFRPEDAPVFFNTTWDFLYVVRLKKVPIAIFSPITLVCPAKQFLKKIHINLDNKWLDILKIGGKEKLLFKFKGEMKEISELRNWLGTLSGNLRCSDSSGLCKDKFEKVLKQLKLFEEMHGQSMKSDKTTPLKKGIYNSINNSIRTEYYFLNNCCDVDVKNEKLKFLVERYREDIFEDKLLLLVHDEAPDTMEREENIYKLKSLYRNIMTIDNDRPIIEVYDNGGKRMAACVFLPFKLHFVSELIQNQITPNEFFGMFTAIYYSTTGQLEITLQIKGFPYYFQKIYNKENWQYLYGDTLEATYIWPIAQVDAQGWKNYYIYTEETRGTGVEVSVPEAVSQIKYRNKSYNGGNNEFQLCKSQSFPAYLCYTYRGVNGFLPIKTQHEGTKDIGSTASIIIDLGHSTTSILIVKEYSGNVQSDTRKEGEDIVFLIPHSSRIVGNCDETKTVNMNFVIPSEDEQDKESSCIKNMMHSFQDYEKVPIVAKERKPFEDGQILFDNSAYLNEFHQSIVSYINFEYALMNQIQREKAHIYIEQLLVYAVYQIIKRECSYVRVYFMHNYREGNARLGELEGLWKNALSNVRQRTGINLAGSKDAIAVKEYEALTSYVYNQVYEENMAEACQIPEDCMNIGINIGWKNSNIVFLSSDASDKSKFKVNCALLEYAGRNISMLVDADTNELNLPVYPQLLKILLGGFDLNGKADIQKMLREFGELFGNKEKDTMHYQGLFDVIAMKIEEGNYYKSPDVFNNMPEFRYYVMTVTYNIMLLFLSVGMLLSKCKDKKEIRRINLFLGGNGAKFLKWISNHKEISEIKQRDKAHELLILQMENGIIEYLEEAAGLKTENTEIRLIMADKPEEQLIQGCRILKLNKEVKLPQFDYEDIDIKMDEKQSTQFVPTVRNLRQEIFKDFPGLKQMNSVNANHSVKEISVADFIENERKEVCKQVIKEITYINNKQYEE